MTLSKSVFISVFFIIALFILVNVEFNNKIKENDKIIEENDKIIEENDKIIEEYDKIIEKNDKIIEKKNKILEEGNKIKTIDMKKISNKQKNDIKKTVVGLCYPEIDNKQGKPFVYGKEDFLLQNKSEVIFKVKIECYTTEYVCPWDNTKKEGVKFSISSGYYALYNENYNYNRIVLEEKIVKYATIENKFTTEYDKVEDGKYFIKTREGHNIPIKVNNGLFEVKIENGDKILNLYSINLEFLGKLHFNKDPYTSRKYQEVHFIKRYGKIKKIGKYIYIKDNTPKEGEISGRVELNRQNI
jgi:hypothetical protein